MKTLLQVVLLLGFVTPSFSAVTEVDFDGNAGKVQNIASFSKYSNDYLNITSAGIVPLRTVDDQPQLIRTAWTQNTNGELVEIKPDSVWRDADGIIRTVYKPWPSQKVQWTLQCKGTSQPTWDAKETYTFASNQSAGHEHHNPKEPPMKVSGPYSTNAQPADSEFYEKESPFYFTGMPTNVNNYYWEWMPVFATSITEEFQSFGACKGTQIDTINVQVPGLSEMPSDENSYILYKTENTMNNHPKCHNGTVGLKTALKTIADNYKAEFPESGVLQIFHMSLPWGGKFDLNNGWGVSSEEDHQGHQYGIEADIRKIKVPLENRNRLIEIMCANTLKVYSETPAHYHLRVEYKEMPYPESLFDYEKSNLVLCCEKGVINQNNLKACIND